MIRRKQTNSRNTRSVNRTKQARTPVANSLTTSVRKPGRPPLTEPFHVAVDRQLKSGHETYEAAEKAALKIKSRYPHLYVTVFDTKEGRHKLIEKPRATAISNENRLAGRNAVV
jgi:hypothetical protein